MNATTRRWVTLGAAAAALLVLAAFLVVRGTAADSSAPDPGRQSAPATPVDPSGGASPTPTLPVRNTPVPPPTPGTINDTVDPVNDGPTESARLEQPIALSDGVKVSLIKVDSIKIKAVGPGDTSGPAVAATVRIENGSDQAINVDSAVVTLSYGKKKLVATPSPADPAKPFAGAIKAGEASEGTYVFRVPAKTQDKVTVQVTYTAGAPVAQFDGAVR